MKYLIQGGKQLHGSIEIENSKNSILPILAACILTDKRVVLHNIPKFSDILMMIKILEHIGLKVEFDDNTIIIDGALAQNYDVPQEVGASIRSSIFAMGAIVSRFKKAKMCYPGGCDIGLRPIDLHLKGLRELNIKIIEQHGFIYCDGKNMTGSNIFLSFPSVGATENIMLASILCEGTTIIYNPAKEPEIFDLQNFINAMGGNVSGAGTNQIIIKGVTSLRNVEYTPISDRIVAGTYMIATAMCGGEVCLKNCDYEQNAYLISLLTKSGCNITRESEGIIIKNDGHLKSIPLIDTQPYPGFPTDLQPQAMSMQTVSNGTCMLIENLYETRSKHVPELIKMGADIKIKDKTAIINGVPCLYGATVFASDLRAGASLILAGLVAKGYTTIDNNFHIKRGYENIHEKLSKLGAEIIEIP